MSGFRGCCGAFSAFSLLFVTPIIVCAAPFTNGNFEMGSGPEVRFPGDTGVTGWTILPHSIDWTHISYWQPYDGSYSVDLSGNDAGGIEQAFDTIAGREYTVAFYMAGSVEGPPTVKHLEVIASGNLSRNYTFDVTGRSTSNMGWTRRIYNFTAASPTTTLSFLSHDPTSHGPFIDAITVSETIPEPSTVSTVVAGFAGAALLRRGRARSKVSGS
jgi:choice-of-anchor C domain-containing protein